LRLKVRARWFLRPGTFLFFSGPLHYLINIFTHFCFLLGKFLGPLFLLGDVDGLRFLFGDGSVAAAHFYFLLQFLDGFIVNMSRRTLITLSLR
jgi:hypothetical protein